MSDNAYDSFVEIAPDSYWVGVCDKKEGLHCNPYLIVDGGEGILIDPGSVLDYERVLEKVKQIIPLEKISYIVLNHQDPDLCSGVPLLEKCGFKGKIATYWRTAVLLKFYGITSEYYLVNEHDFELFFKSGRKLKFLQTPYLHFPGAITTYDPQTKILYSSDLFGGFTYNWELWANGNYMESMKLFHENYMPSNDILRPVMEMFLGMDISMIAPQHGSIIRDDIKTHIKALRDLECGAFLKPIKKELTENGGFTGIVNQVLKRYYSTFDKDEVMTVFADTEIVINSETGLIEDYNCTGRDLWNLLFDVIFAKKGISWITIASTLVTKLINEYDVPEPSVFKDEIFNIEKKSEALALENKKLKELNDRLVHSLETAKEQLIKCPLTDMYNASFCKNYLKAEIKSFNIEHVNAALCVFDIDNLSKLAFKYGHGVENETLKNAAYLLKQFKSDEDVFFKLDGAFFAWYMPSVSPEEALVKAESLRTKIAESDLFVEKITISVGLVSLNEIFQQDLPSEEAMSLLRNIALLRHSIAKGEGMNQVCSVSTLTPHKEAGSVLIVDTETQNAELLKHLLSDSGINVEIVGDGEKALVSIEKKVPDVIISEIMLPKLDGFALRNQLMGSTKLKSIPYILISYRKDEDSITRALSLGIEHYFKKPYILSELVGIIKNKIKQQG